MTTKPINPAGAFAQPLLQHVAASQAEYQSCGPALLALARLLARQAARHIRRNDRDPASFVKLATTRRQAADPSLKRDAQ